MDGSAQFLYERIGTSIVEPVEFGAYDKRIVVHPKLINEKIEMFFAAPKITLGELLERKVAEFRFSYNESKNILSLNIQKISKPFLYLEVFMYDIKLIIPKNFKTERHFYRNDSYVTLSKEEIATLLPNYQQIQIDEISTEVPPPPSEEIKN
jgi:hypothetical protein